MPQYFTEGTTDPQARFMNQLSRWFPLILVCAGIVCYANSFDGPFIYDDNRVVLNNPHLFTLWPPWRAILVPTRFVADLSFALNFTLGGLTPADFRMTGVMIHVLCGLLLYGIVRRTLTMPRLAGRYASSSSLLAFASALLWIVHPLQTESVTYIAQRIEALMGLFYLLIFYCFIRGLTASHPRRWMNAALIACGIGMGTKEVIVTAPVVLFIYDCLFAPSGWREVLRQRWKIYTALFLTWGIFAMLFIMGMTLAMEKGLSLVSVISPWRYALTQSAVILHYFRLSFAPLSLCLSYRWPFAASLGEVWWQAATIIALLVTTLWGLFRRRLFSFPLVWIFGILAPTSSFLPIADAAFEHRMYLPLAGLITGVVVGTQVASEAVCRSATWRRPALVMLLLVVSAWFMKLTMDRNLDYRSEEAVWRDIIAKRPENFNPYIALSREMIGDNRLDEAYAILTNALARMPDFSNIPYLELRKRYAVDFSLPCVEYAMAHNNLGVVYLNRKQLDEAATHFREAIRVFPSNHIGYFNMGRIALIKGQTNEAVGWWQDAHRRKPDDIDTLCLLAIHYASQANYSNSAACYRQVMEWNPDHPFARAQLAWLLATCPDNATRNGSEAVLLARKLPAMSGGRSARAYDILATAEAEAGNYERAVEMAESALRAAENTVSEARLPARSQPLPDQHDNSTQPPDPKGRSYVDAIKERLDLYRRHLPYRSFR